VARDIDEGRCGTKHSTPNPNPTRKCVAGHLQRSDVMHHEREGVDVHGVVVRPVHRGPHGPHQRPPRHVVARQIPLPLSVEDLGLRVEGLGFGV